MTVFNIDLEDGRPPVTFTLKPSDAKRFVEFMAEMQSLRSQLAEARARVDELEARIDALPELLGDFVVIDRCVIDDADDYDDGITLRRIERVKRHMLSPAAQLAQESGNEGEREGGE